MLLPRLGSTFLAALTFAASLQAADWPQFRGPDRTGITPEKGLLRTWPKDGPKLLWTYKNAGLGFSSPSIVGDRAYILGGADADGEYVFCLDLKTQKELWKTKIGPLFIYQNWGDGPRSSATVAGEVLYALGGHGDLVCVQTADGKEVWRKNLAKDLGGEMMTEWGYSESPLVDGDLLIVTPGGKEGTLAALNRKSGAVVWRSKGLDHKAPYSSVMISHAAGVKQYVQTSYIDEREGGFVSGFDVKTGTPLWTENIFKRHSYAIAPTPIVQMDQVYVTSGYGGGCHLFQISKAGAGLAAKNLYGRIQNKNMKNTHGGVVLLDGHVYGHSETLGWVCQTMKTGKIAWNERNLLECRSGAIAASADGLLFLYSDEGETVLLQADPKEWKETGRFSLPETSELRKNRESLRSSAVWTHPVIADGKLYLRDQELIFCYQVK